MKLGNNRKWLFAALTVCAAVVYGQQGIEKISLSVLKGPSGISGAWMMADPPSVPGIQLSFTTAASADLVIAKLISGEIAGGVLPVNVAAKLYNSGLHLCVIASVGDGMVKFLTNDASIVAFHDLSGKEIAIAGQKATPDYLFKFLADANGLSDEKDYRAVYNLGYPEIAAQLAVGKISCAVLPEPFATQALMLNPRLRSPIDLGAQWSKATGLSSYPMSILVVSSSLVSRRPDFIKALSAAYESSITRTVADPAKTGELAESLELGMKAAVAKAAIPASAYVFRPADAARKSIEALLSVFLGFDPKSIGGKLPDDLFYLNSALLR
ncbi:MAG: ABC transporter substrate-binding protein [Spirochaetes bacterium]|nr:ABC transporter substrate-binding protein [Spirochaetota bacterium]